MGSSIWINIEISGWLFAAVRRWVLRGRRWSIAIWIKSRYRVIRLYKSTHLLSHWNSNFTPAYPTPLIFAHHTHNSSLRASHHDRPRRPFCVRQHTCSIVVVFMHQSAMFTMNEVIQIAELSSSSTQSKEAADMNISLASSRLWQAWFISTEKHQQVKVQREREWEHDICECRLS